MRRASVTVFVDDYIHGRLPEICAVTGDPTPDQVRLRTNVARISQAWFLAPFLGAIGWLALALAFAGTREVLEGWLPYSHDEARRRRSQRMTIAAGGVFGSIGALLLHIVFPSDLLIWLAALAVVGSVVAFVVMSTGEPRIGVDPSRRWVTIDRCHPSFAAAVEPSRRASSLS